MQHSRKGKERAIDGADIIDYQPPIENRMIEVPPPMPGRPSHDDLLLTASMTLEHATLCDGPRCQTRQGSKSIRGVRYKCTVCDDVDYCISCARDGGNKHDPSHPFLRCVQNVQVLIDRNIKDRHAQTFPGALQNKPLTTADIDRVVCVKPRNRWRPPNGARHSLEEANIPDWRKESEDWVNFVMVRPQQPEKRAEPRITEKSRVPPDTDAVAMYTINEDASVTVEERAVAAPAQTPGTEGVIHDQDAETLLKVLTGEMKFYQYPRQDKFYRDVWAGKLATRLVDLKPGAFRDRLECSIRPVDLSERPTYEALSYTWKETAYERQHAAMWTKEVDQAFRSMLNFRHAIYCDDQYLEINVGLRDALRRLRHPTRLKTYWIDQLSINQNDLGERSLQVQGMRYFYNLAQRVVVWTGDEDEDTVNAVDLIRKVASRCNVPVHALPTLHELIRDSDLGLPPPDSLHWLSLLRFFLRPVFQRSWVIQEVALGQQVVVRCGDMEMSWSQIAKVAIFISQPNCLRTLPVHQAIKGLPMPPWGFVIHMNGFREDFQTLKDISLETRLFLSRIYHASDPRDKIYAVLGIQSARKDPRSFEGLQPDYTKSVQQVYIEATKEVVLGEKSFSVCGLDKDRSRKSVANLPSWVPDFSNTTLMNPFSRPDLNPYHASGDSETMAVWDPAEPTLLVTSACPFDSIAAVSDRIMTNDRPEVALIIQEWMELASQLGPQYVTGETLCSAFWRTTVGNATVSWRVSPAPDHYYMALVQSWVTRIALTESEDRIRADAGPSPLLHQMSGDFLRANPDLAESQTSELPDIDREPDGAFLINCLDRKMFLTANGYLGIGPADAQVGDEVHILSGGKVPFVMRKCPESVFGVDDRSMSEIEPGDLPTYTLLGETYVHGVMQGEVLQRDDFEWTGICIN